MAGAKIQMTPTRAIYRAALVVALGFFTAVAVNRVRAQDLSTRNELTQAKRHPRECSWPMQLVLMPLVLVLVQLRTAIYPPCQSRRPVTSGPRQKRRDAQIPSGLLLSGH